MKHSLIVTGGAGFIGSNFVRLALRHDVQKVAILDKLTYAGHLATMEDVRRDARVQFIQADIADRAAVENLIRTFHPSAILNFAAETHVDRSIEGPGAFIHTNVLGTFELLEAARTYVSTLGDQEKNQFRFLHVSTDEVYGSLGKTGLFSEETPYAPTSPYSASKASADHLVHSYHKTYGLPTLITNCSNNYGPFQFPEKLIPLIILNAVEGKELPVYGDGGQVRDWIFVDDHCEGIWRVLEGGRVGEKYNIGAGEEHVNLDVVNAICTVLEDLKPAAKNPSLAQKNISRYHGLQKFVTDRPGHDRRYAIDSTKVRRDLGWKPAHSFQDGIRETIQWYLNHRAWCDAVQSGNYQRERLGLIKEKETVE